MDFSWKVIIDAGFISLALIAATALRFKLRFLQKYLIPNALSAGFLLLPVYNFLLPALGYESNKLGELVYHLLSISFISMSLRAAPPKIRGHKGGGVFGMSVGILMGYATQALLGLALTLLFLPGLHPAFGLHLPLGFALGPGQAYAIGKGWESMGFNGGATVGLTFAALGYLWACFGGIVLINTGLRKAWLTKEGCGALKDMSLLSGIVAADKEKPLGARLSTDSEAIDSFSFHVALVLVTYFVSFLLLKGLCAVLSLTGNAGKELAVNLWGINFIFSAVTAIALRQLFDISGKCRIIDNDTMSRIAGFSVDYMVAGAIGAITLTFVGKYWFPLLLMSTLCGCMVFFTVPWLCSRMFSDHRFERMLMLYGVSTGTLSTGLALLRVVDPEFKTQVASDYTLSAGLTFLLAIPFVLSINLPAKVALTASMHGYWLMMGICGAYMLYVIAGYMVLAKKRSFAKPWMVWYEE